MKYYAIAIIPLILAYPVYSWLSPSESLEQKQMRLIEEQNQIITETNNTKLERYKLELIECMQSASGEILSELDACKKRPKPVLQELVGTNAKATTGSVIPVPERKWYTAKHELILSGSHDYRIYSSRDGAVWKNNNPSWLTWGVSNTLKGLWKERGIHFEKWTFRPKVEWWNYILFLTIEDWLRAKIVSVRERWWTATVEHFLAGWGTDYVTLSFDKSKRIKNLTEEEFAELFIQQLKKESPWLVDQLVKDWILIVK